MLWAAPVLLPGPKQRLDWRPWQHVWAWYAPCLPTVLYPSCVTCSLNWKLYCPPPLPCDTRTSRALLAPSLRKARLMRRPSLRMTNLAPLSPGGGVGPASTSCCSLAAGTRCCSVSPVYSCTCMRRAPQSIARCKSKPSIQTTKQHSSRRLCCGKLPHCWPWG